MGPDIQHVALPRKRPKKTKKQQQKSKAIAYISDFNPSYLPIWNQPPGNSVRTRARTSPSQLRLQFLWVFTANPPTRSLPIARTLLSTDLSASRHFFKTKRNVCSSSHKFYTFLHQKRSTERQTDRQTGRELQGANGF